MQMKMPTPSLPSHRVKAGRLRNKRRHQDRARGDDVVFGVLCCGNECFGIDTVAQRAVECGHPELNEHGCSQCRKGNERVSGGGRLDDLGDRLEDQVDADGANQDGDKQAGEVLVAAVAIGVAFVCRAAGEAEPEQAHDVARGIGEVVESVGDEGDGASEQARDALGQAQGDVEANADEACGEAALVRREVSTGSPSLPGTSVCTSRFTNSIAVVLTIMFKGIV